MTNKKSTLRALLLSAISVIACVAMLVGTTFAWFTDSVSSMNNIIKSGNLDLVLEYSTDGANWIEVDEDTKIFDDEALYEPGYTEVVFLRVSNAGSLALKYSLAANIISETPSTNVYGESFKLSDYLQIGTYAQAEYNGVDNWGALFPYMFATRDAARAQVAANAVKLSEFTGASVTERPMLPGDTTAELVALVLYMPEEVGNEANHLTGVAAPEITFGLTALATQYTYEEDSFGIDYDEDAEYPALATTFAELKDALAAGKDVVVAGNIVMDEVITINGNQTITIGSGDLDTDVNVTRPFELGDGANLTINAGSKEITVGKYGLVNIPAGSDAAVTLNGGIYTANTDNGAFIKPRQGSKSNITLNNVTYTDVSNDGFVVNSSGADDVTLNVNGGTFESARSFVVAGADISIVGAKITANEASAIEVGNGSTAVIKDCELIVNGANYPAAPPAGVSASKGGDVVVENCTITSALYGLAIYSDSSAGEASTIVATGCTINAAVESWINDAMVTNSTITIN